LYACACLKKLPNSFLGDRIVSLREETYQRNPKGLIMCNEGRLVTYENNKRVTGFCWVFLAGIEVAPSALRR